jgi:hypothetical protein
MAEVPRIPTYVKPYRTVVGQIALLQSRGMEITDVAAAAACLGRIGYYRLSGYWYASRKSHATVNPLTGVVVPHPITGKPQVIVEDDFRTGATFQQVRTCTSSTSASGFYSSMLSSESRWRSVLTLLCSSALAIPGPIEIPPNSMGISLKRSTHFMARLNIRNGLSASIKPSTAPKMSS